MIQSREKWYQVYPQGTSEGNEEQAFFKALARNPDYEWRSPSALAKESGLSPKRVGEIITKYHKRGIILSNEDGSKYAYWERVPDVANKDQSSITQKDQKSRIDTAVGKAPVFAGAGNGKAPVAAPVP